MSFFEHIGEKRTTYKLSGRESNSFMIPFPPQVLPTAPNPLRLSPKFFFKFRQKALGPKGSEITWYYGATNGSSQLDQRLDGPMNEKNGQVYVQYGSWIVQCYVSAFDLHLQIYIGNRGLLASYDSAKWASVPSLMPLDIDSALLCARLVNGTSDHIYSSAFSGSLMRAISVFLSPMIRVLNAKVLGKKIVVTIILHPIY